MRDNTVSAGWKKWLMLASDIHFDSIKCDIKLFEKHLKLANSRKAIVLIAGDFFDSMQSRDDPRRNIEELKEKYAVSHYMDALVLDASEYLGQFKDIHYILALGNHETSVLKKLSTNLIDRVASNVRIGGGHAINAGYYGWLNMLFSHNGSQRQSYKLFFHHGSGGSAPVTKGVIQTSRQAEYIDADIILNGHNHRSYYVPLKRLKISSSGRQVCDMMHFIRTPGYKISGLENGDRFGFDVERIPGVTPRGCTFLEFSDNSGRVELRVHMEQE